MAFFCALEPEARSWPLASPQSTFDAAVVFSPVPAARRRCCRPSPRREDQGAGDGEGTERGGAKPVLALKLHFRVFLPGAAVVRSFYGGVRWVAVLGVSAAHRVRPKLGRTGEAADGGE
ncbi:hypothetical protein [Streptomyces griseus]